MKLSVILARRALSVVTGMAVLMALASPAAIAAYRRPQDARPPSPATGTSGTRDSSVMGPNGLRPTMLAPKYHVGKTLSTRPTFTWFMPVDAPIPGEFQLYEITGENRFSRVFDEPYPFESTPGLMSFTVPESAAALEPGKDYIWQVLLRYGPGSGDIYIMRSQVQVVADPQLSATLSEAAELRLEQLAEAGFWYDALALVTQASSDANNRRRIELLEELAAVDIVEGDREDAATTTPDVTDTEGHMTDGDEGTSDASDASAQGEDRLSHHQVLRLIASLIAE